MFFEAWVEVINVSITYAGQVFAEVLFYTPPTDRTYCSQIFAEVLIPSDPRVLIPLYPAPPNTTLPPGDFAAAPQLMGFSYTVFKRPTTNSGVYQGPSGREIRVLYYDAIIWQWDLHYEYLPDDPTQVNPGTTESDFHTLVAFFQQTRGGQLPFTFYDPDDNQVVGTRIGEADGVTQEWVITREYGAEWKEVEPVGYLSYTPPNAYQVPYGPEPAPPNQPVVYLDNVVVDPLTYEIIRNELGKQTLRFHQPPVSGLITMDFHFVFFTRFADLIYDFEEFINKVWSAQKITLESMRSYVR